VRGAEGTATFLPGISLKDAWSKPLKNYVRNVALSEQSWMVRTDAGENDADHMSRTHWKPNATARESDCSGPRKTRRSIGLG
jgi:hypothetical protein